ncbi:MAG TPA: glutathione S-transferase N-terminal domain-containing protein [Myxococcota bacterium]|jgi:glutathione S-transferase|nr:glutathione S-transferase N-terminal domain-containing protein [Myxococcota bacterium]
MNRTLDVASSLAASAARLFSGLSVGSLGKRPEKPLELYEFESCPYCRKVREALTILDLEALVFPCPKGGRRFRDEVARRGGKLQFPWLVDPNTGREMYESDEIVAYLFSTYGDGHVPALLALGPLTLVTSSLASGLRVGLGTNARPSRAPAKPLELYSFEVSPFCRIAREALCALEIPYLLHNVGKGSPSREAFVRRSGKMMVPFLVDPNTGKEMFESADIVRYLDETYGAR